jgi:dynein heavy chain 2
MGQGQADEALRVLRESAQHGDWLCLKNLHLVTAWLPELEAELARLTPHEEFRLWLTTEEHPSFSAILLQSSLKLTFEAPPGIKKNLQRSYDGWSAASVGQHGSLHAQCLFILAWLHAVVQERRIYIPQGWTKMYEFSASDLRAAADVLAQWSEHAKRTQRPDWDRIHGLIVNALHGGRIDNPFDMQVLRAYLQQYFNGTMVALGPGSRPSARLAAGISIPTSTHHSDYVEATNAVPDVDRPEVFGLPANIEKAVQERSGEETVQRLRVMQRADTLGQQFDRQAWGELLQPVLQAWSKLTQSTALGGEKLPKAQGDDPMANFVVLERSSGLALVRKVMHDVDQLQAVLRGTALLTPYLDMLARALLRRETPGVWLQRWEGPEEELAWCRAVVSKTLALQAYVTAAQDGSLTGQREVNLASFFRPHTFFNALRQKTAQTLGCSMDALVFTNSWAGQQLAQVPVTCTVAGLGIQGCTFDGARLHEADRSTPTLVPLAAVRVGFVQRQHAPHPNSDQLLELPLYASPSREKVVARMQVPCGGNQAKWVLAGVALFLTAT